ncbi:MAG: transglycosylase SLT domain-containing protein [Dehalococcoidia bacterium]
MSLDAISGVTSVSASGAPEPIASSAAAGPTAAQAAPFSAVLQRHLDAPRRDISGIRSEIAAIRAGAPFWRQSAPREGGAPGTGSASMAALDLYGTASSYTLPPRTGDVADPYGWRSTSRDLAERIIGPGYGDLFERQMDQESGFIPDVVFGKRVSSAGAEGIAQLMPQYYQHVDRTDPVAGLTAGAQTMRHYLTVWDGDVRKALASYNAGLGRVQSLVDAHGANWEAGLPLETRHYLGAIVGGATPTFTGVTAAATTPASTSAAVFGGRGPGGVLSSPLEGVTGRRSTATGVDFFGAAGAIVTAPSDGVTVEAGGGRVVLDHGNGWLSALDGLASTVGVGTNVRRGEAVGSLGAGGLLRLGVTSGGEVVDPARYLLDVD